MIKIRQMFVACFALMFCSVSALWAQDYTVKGSVKDVNGNPMAGVSILVVGTGSGMTTDTDGSFSLRLNDSRELQFSYLGYESQTVNVSKNTTEVSVILKENYQNLEEVVVIGYGVQKKSDVTGSMVSVNKEAIMANAPTNINQALQGKAPGLMIVSSGDPGSSATVRVRGNRSISASNDPLYVVDGIPLVSGIDDIDPNIIESIEVLKDASATAIYGARGANGVILVTTKRGAEGKASVSYSGNVSFGTIYRERELFNAAEYADYVREAYRNSPSSANIYNSATPSWEEDSKNPIFKRSEYVLESLKQAYDSNGNYDPSKVRGYDWQDAGLNDFALKNQHTLSVSGGTKNTKVFVSGSINTDKGIKVNNESRRYTINANIDQVINRFLTIGAQTSFSYNEFEPGQNVYSAAAAMSPLANPYDDNGELILHPGGDPLLYNPLLDLYNSDALNKNTRTYNNLYASFDLADGLNFKTTYGINNSSSSQGRFYGASTSTMKETYAQASYSTDNMKMWTLENLLTYGKDFGDHSLSANLLQSAQKYIDETSSIKGEDLPYETQKWYDLGSASSRTVSSGYTQWSMLSYMGRVNYGYKGKYLATVSARYDGSSRLAQGSKWVLFPSAALAWRISEENFLKGSNVVSNLKLRAGWGKTGNSSVNPYATLGGLTISRYSWNSDDLAVGYYPSDMANSTLTWETTEQTNLGLDFGFLNGRISGSVDYYIQNTYDLLMPRSLPQTSGFSSITANIGKTRNTGVEVALTTVNIDKKDWKWMTTFTYSYNKEKLVDLGYTDGDDVGNNWFIGQPVRVFYNYVFDGVWGTDDAEEMAKFNANGHSFAVGDPKIKDDGNYKITDDDREIVGKRFPDTNIGFSSTLQYKNWDLYVFAYGVFGSTMYYDMGVSYDGRFNSVKFDYWTPTHQNTRYFRPEESRSDFAYEDVSYYFKGDFIRIGDITLGYTFPKTITSKLNISNLRLYFKANRPFLFTDFPGNDPEGGVGGSSFSYGADSPSLRYWMFGINFSF